MPYNPVPETGPVIPPVAPPPPLHSVTLPDLLAMDIPPRENLLAPWLPHKGLAMVFAPRGVGKTHFGLGVAHAVASGSAFLRWQAPGPRKVLLIDGEMPAGVLQERLARIVAHADQQPPGDDYIRLLSSDLQEFGLPDLASVEGQAMIEPHIGDAALLVVDNLSSLARSGKENEAESWSVIQGWALRMRREGRSVLFVHHAGKGGEQRGTSRREDILDTVIKLSRPDDYAASEGARFNVEFTKARGLFGADADSFEARFADGTWSTQLLEDVRFAQAMAFQASGMNCRDIAQEMGIGKSTVARLLKANGGAEK